MPVIELTTEIKSGIETCFDLARSIDLHRISTEETHEQAIAGRTSGLIGLNEFVTWRARHLGITQTLTSKITACERPFHFRDEQQRGPFKFLLHDHYFSTKDGIVLMQDVFSFSSPFGLAGKLFDYLFLRRYLLRFLVRRNDFIKEFAERGDGKQYLQGCDSPGGSLQ